MVKRGLDVTNPQLVNFMNKHYFPAMLTQFPDTKAWLTAAIKERALYSLQLITFVLRRSFTCYKMTDSFRETGHYPLDFNKMIGKCLLQGDDLTQAEKDHMFEEKEACADEGLREGWLL